jgi:transposase
MIQLARLFLMFQKDSTLAQWFRAHTESVRGTRKTIALWRLVREGVVPDGVILRPASTEVTEGNPIVSAPVPLVTRSPMTVLGGGVPTCLLGLQCRKGEWVRRFGASLPMRMIASWFGSLDPPDTRLWRVDRARKRAPL